MGFHAEPEDAQARIWKIRDSLPKHSFKGGSTFRFIVPGRDIARGDERVETSLRRLSGRDLGWTPGKSFSNRYMERGDTRGRVD
jgi:hypothetical protein